MIRKVKFSNFYSFHGEQEISFLANKKKTYDYYNSSSKDQITKVAGFAGPNASGKTNAMRLFSFISYFVCREVNEGLPFIPELAYKTFFNNTDPSDFYIEFEVDQTIYFYSFKLQNKKILTEKLSARKIKKNAQEEEVFVREAETVKSLNKHYFQNISIEDFPKVRDDVSAITLIKKSTYSVDVINQVYSYFQGLKTNINERGEKNHLGLQIKTLNLYLDDPEIKQEAENFICNFDLGLKGFEIKKEVKEPQSFITVNGIHSTKSENNKLDFAYESSGTQSLFFAMANIISALKNNNIVILDEIETGFHPEALNKLISYFIDENKDSHAQLIFSSHSLGFMNRLDMHQIFLVNSNENGESKVVRLNKVKGIRPDENFMAKYLSGSYGAFPEIRT